MGTLDGSSSFPEGTARLERLFAGQPVVTEEVALGEPIPAPHPDEARQVARAVPRRQVEFAAGRHCARLALRRLGVDDVVLLNGEDRAPRWPAGIVGAITHTGDLPGGYCGVAVARAAEVLALGLDAEEAQPLEDRLWSYVLNETERRALERAAPAERGLLAKIVFSAKECFYKAQYPLTGRFLRFDEVEVALRPADNTFEAQPLVDLGLGPRMTRCAGRFAVDEALILTGLAIARGSLD